MSIRRDYKSTANGRQRRQAVRRHGLLVMTLVLVGLFSGLLAYIKGDRLQPTPAAAVATATPTPSVRGNATVDAKGGTGKPATPAPETTLPALTPTKPKYDFYTELPKRQVDIHPEEPSAKTPRAAPSKPQPVANPPRKPAMPGIITPAGKTTATTLAAAPRPAPSTSLVSKRSPTAEHPAVHAPVSATTTRTAGSVQPPARGQTVAVKID